ncbi:MAG: type B 50S ribosomal protein L31 [Patescibacteria group bacterium]|nr:type B 50S ribosomal protein L31 [Patescibacteria group bacterium]
MKSDIHPQNYRPVVFQDAGSGAQFIIGSTVATDQTTTVDGKEYPLYVVEISSASHPFYTGKSTTLDRAGRVDRFKKRTAARTAKAKN